VPGVAGWGDAASGGGFDGAQPMVATSTAESRSQCR
jgi:hypothetical protein